MALCFLQVLREPVVQYLAGSEQRIAPFWDIITWYPTYAAFGCLLCFPSGAMRTTGKQCGLAATGVYQPSLRSPWLAAWVAMAGLDPKHHQSGSSINKKARISKVGNRYLRQALYMPALSAARHDKHVNGYYKAPDRKSWTQENTGHLCGDAQVVTRRSRHAQTTKAI